MVDHKSSQINLRIPAVCMSLEDVIELQQIITNKGFYKIKKKKKLYLTIKIFFRAAKSSRVFFFFFFFFFFFI